VACGTALNNLELFLLDAFFLVSSRVQALLKLNLQATRTFTFNLVIFKFFSGTFNVNKTQSHAALRHPCQLKVIFQHIKLLCDAWQPQVEQISDDFLSKSYSEHHEVQGGVRLTKKSEQKSGQTDTD